MKCPNESSNNNKSQKLISNVRFHALSLLNTEGNFVRNRLDVKIMFKLNICFVFVGTVVVVVALSIHIGSFEPSTLRQSTKPLRW
jgi:hypothetical protein